MLTTFQCVTLEGWVDVLYWVGLIIMIISLSPKCILGTLETIFHDQKNVTFGRGITELVRNALFS